ncbi:MAG TPA: NUDIX domain-containing protein [Acidimicrobiales bacterium]
MTSDSAAAELVDVVDEEDRVVGTVTRARVRADRLLHRGVFIVVRRSGGDVLVHQRSADKDVWPSAWDIAVGGVVAAGEGWDEAAARELAEEVGIRGVVPRFARSGRYSDDEVDEVARVYALTWDGPIAFLDGEVVAAEWITPAELDARIAAHPFCPDSLALARDLIG